VRTMPYAKFSLPMEQHEVPRLRRDCGWLLSVLSAAVTICMFAFPVTAQQEPLTPRNAREPLTTARSHPLTVPIAARPVSSAMPTEQAPTISLQVSYDGELLTISAENCTLYEILDAVRTRTGAEIDLAERGSGQRMTVKLGPGPGRQVLSTLLGWSEFDYVIQGSDTDPQAIRNVILMPRSKTSGSGAVSASSPAASSRQPLVSTTHHAIDPTPAPADNVTPDDPAAATQTPAPTASPTASTEPDLSPMPLERPIAPTVPVNTSGVGSTPTQVRPLNDMIQSMQQMFEQRRQMQQEQNANPSMTPKAPTAH
jgi:hypothetical protein